MRSRNRRLALLAFNFWLLPSFALAQFVPQRYSLTDAERSELTAARDRLQQQMRALAEQSRRTGTPRADQLPDAEIYVDGLDRTLRQELFFATRDVANAQAVIKEGEARIAALKGGQAPWESTKSGIVVLGHRSKVDGTAQPYQVSIPDRPTTRLEVLLHGRAGTLSEVNFLASSSWTNSNYLENERWCYVLYPYGRSNNGWRFAGERDMFEAMEDLRRRFKIDSDRIVLRGFSMGGHGTWHIGLQHPGRWAAMSPGAGFTDTINYQKITERLPDWQLKLLRLYDPVDYAANAANLPVLAYVGDQDPAIDQHRQMVASMKQEGAPFKEFIGPNTPHRYEAVALRTILRDLAGQLQTNTRASGSIRFTTYTLRWPECRWIRIEGLRRHWERADVHVYDPSRALVHPGEGLPAPQQVGGREWLLNTRNVRALSLRPPPQVASAGIAIDGQRLNGLISAGKEPIRLVLQDGRWQRGQLTGVRKKPGLQGPIDDALFGPVMAVSGGGSQRSLMDGWARQELQRFREGWDRYFRGRPRERTDLTLTAADVRDHNLYLFGDPASNAVIRRLLPRLPLKWSADEFTIDGKTFDTKLYLPMLIYPNPENPERYVVINSGFTFSRADWEGSNARQFPHLPDYAVIRYLPGRFADERWKDTVLAGFFDERWKL